MKRPCATAFVIGRKVEGGPIMVPEFHVYDQAQLNFQAFFTEQEAREWVHSVLESD